MKDERSYISSYFAVLQNSSKLAVVKDININNTTNSCTIDELNNHVVAPGNENKPVTYIIDSTAYGFSTIAFDIKSNDKDEISSITMYGLHFDTLDHARKMYTVIYNAPADQSLSLQQLTEMLYKKLDKDFDGAADTVYDMEEYENVYTKFGFFNELIRDINDFQEIVYKYHKFSNDFLNYVKDCKIRDLAAQVEELKTKLSILSAPAKQDSIECDTINTEKI